MRRVAARGPRERERAEVPGVARAAQTEGLSVQGSAWSVRQRAAAQEPEQAGAAELMAAEPQAEAVPARPPDAVAPSPRCVASDAGT